MLSVTEQTKSRVGTQVRDFCFRSVVPNTATVKPTTEEHSGLSHCSWNKCSDSTHLSLSSRLAPTPSNQLLLPTPYCTCHHHSLVLKLSSASPFSAPTSSPSACHQLPSWSVGFKAAPAFLSSHPCSNWGPPTAWRGAHRCLNSIPASPCTNQSDLPTPPFCHHGELNALCQQALTRVFYA